METTHPEDELFACPCGDCDCNDELTDLRDEVCRTCWEADHMSWSEKARYLDRLMTGEHRESALDYQESPETPFKLAAMDEHL